MQFKNRLIAALLVAAFAMSVLLVPASAMAQTKRQKDAKNEKNHRVAASVLGAAGLYLYGRKNTTLGTIALAGSAYEAKRMQDSINARHKREQAAAYRRGYSRGRYVALHRTNRTGNSHYVWVTGKDGKKHKVLVKNKPVVKVTAKKK